MNAKVLKYDQKIPPWEIASRLAYRRRKFKIHLANLRKGIPPIKRLYQCLASYESNIKSLVGQNCQYIDKEIGKDVLLNPFGGAVSKDFLKKLNAKIVPVISDITLEFQHLSLVASRKYEREKCVEIVKKIEPFLSLMPGEIIFRFLVSLATVTNARVFLFDKKNSENKYCVGNIKKNCWKICERLFGVLHSSESIDMEFKRNEKNIFHMINSYLRLCASYGQDSSKFGEFYKDTIRFLTSENVYISENIMDDILAVYGALGIYDANFIIYYADRIAKHFSSFSENQIANFCRYMVRIIRLLSGTGIRDCNFDVVVDYSSKIDDSRQTEILRWNFKCSNFVNCLELELPFVLHEYTYYNLIDIAEMYLVYGLLESKIIPRFSTELWRHLYTLKYGYPMKSLIILSKLGLGDSATFGRLVRNIPLSLTFRWPLPMVMETMISSLTLGIKCQKFYNRLSEYIQRYIDCKITAETISRLFRSLGYGPKGIQVQGLYDKIIKLEKLQKGWLDLPRLLLIAEYGVTAELDIDPVLELLQFKHVDRCSISDLAPLFSILPSKVTINSGIAADTVLYLEDGKKERNELSGYSVNNKEDKYLKIIIRSLKRIITLNESESERANLDSLFRILEGLSKLRIRFCGIEKLCVDSLANLKDSENVNIVKLIGIFARLGRVDSVALKERLVFLLSKKLQSLDAAESAQLIWDLWAISVNIKDETFLKVTRIFNNTNKCSKPPPCSHLLLVLATLLRLESNIDTPISKEWLEFAEITKGYKDDSWHCNVCDAEKIKKVAETIKGSDVFVRAHPYTIYISAPFDSLEYTLTTNIPSGNKEKKVALFYYEGREMPVILTCDENGVLSQEFDFYFTVRRKILMNRGYLDTLTFTIL